MTEQVKKVLAWLDDTNRTQIQIRRVLLYLEAHGTITQKEANTISVARLAAVVHRMREFGIPVEKTTETSVNQYGETVRFARYKIAA